MSECPFSPDVAHILMLYVSIPPLVVQASFWETLNINEIKLRKVFISVEEVCGMSGILAVVVLGLTMNSERTMISPEVETFLNM